jgi:hypothetical protein
MRWTRRLAATVVFALGCGLVANAAGASSQDEQQKAQRGAETALACSRNMRKGLRFVPKESTVLIRVERGKIPDTSGGLRGADVYQVFTITGAESAELREFALTGNSVIISGDGYVLRYISASKNWIVVDGNGGSATYEAVSRYVKGMLRRVPGRAIPADALKEGKCKFPDGRTVRGV